MNTVDQKACPDLRHQPLGREQLDSVNFVYRADTSWTLRVMKANSHLRGDLGTVLVGDIRIHAVVLVILCAVTLHSEMQSKR